MKNLLYFSLVVLLLGVGGCKKDKCNGVVCLNGGQCVDGVCQCNSEWTGSNCDIPQTPIDSFIGNYHMTGYSQSWISGTSSGPFPIDDTMAIIKVNDSTLHASGFDLYFTKGYWAADTLHFYTYLWMPGNPSSYNKLSFHKPFDDDSAFYESHGGGLGGSYSTNLRGIKIH